MRKVTWLLFLGYFSLFVVLGIVFYFKFLSKFISSGAAPEKVKVVETSKIYYSLGNNLWRVSPDTLLNTIERTERFQSTGLVNFLDYNKFNNFFAYTSINSDGLNDIWQVSLATNQSEKITDAKDPRYEILKNYLNFYRPKYSPDGNRLAFIARSGAKDSILIKDLATGDVADATPNSQSHILDFSWENNGEKIVYCSQGLAKNYAEILDVAKVEISQKIEIEALEVSWQATEIIYLSQGNLFRLKEGTTDPQAITNIQEPKKVAKFEIDPQGQNIVYEINDGSSSDIYLAKTDGTNIIELTNMKNATQPMLSPDGNQVAFLRQNDGIYTIDANKTAEAKILNLPEKIDYLLLWR